MATRLTEHEIDRALARIRSEYDRYIVHFMKSAEVKRQFEDRYSQALRMRMDLATFLMAEIEAVKILLEKARVDQYKPAPAPRAKAPKKLSYADKIVEQLRAKIKDYPNLGLPDHPERSPDVDKLYGTLRWFRKELWDVIYPIFLGKCPSPGLFAADTDLGALTLQGTNWPKEVEAYVALYLGTAELSQVARAQNRCLLQAAQLLQRIRMLMHASVDDPKLTDRERDAVRRAVAFCDRVLGDFRLKELATRS